MKPGRSFRSRDLSHCDNIIPFLSFSSLGTLVDTGGLTGTNKESCDITAEWGIAGRRGE